MKNLLNLLTVCGLLLSLSCEKEDSKPDNQVPVPVVKTPAFDNSVASASEAASEAGFKVSSTLKENGGAAITQHGHVWSETKADPTTADSKTELGKTEGPFPLKFTSEAKGLKGNTSYYVRPYALNEKGLVYGSVIQVKTSGASTGSALKIKANFPGTTRNSFAQSFMVGNKWYIMGGVKNASPTTYFNDVWEYDPAQDDWAKKASIPTENIGTYRAMNMASGNWMINNKVYVVIHATFTQGNPDKSFLYEFDPSTDKWVSKGQIPFSLTSASMFALNNMGYLIGGGGTFFNSSDANQQVHEYDPQNNTWKKKKDFTGKARYGTITESSNGKGYLLGGLDKDAGFLNEMWEYDGATDNWSKMAIILPYSEGPYNRVLQGNSLTVFTSYYYWKFDFASKLWTKLDSHVPVLYNNAIYGGANCGGYYTDKLMTISGPSFYFLHLDKAPTQSCNANLMGQLWEYTP